MNIRELYKGFLKWTWLIFPVLKIFHSSFPCKSFSLQVITKVCKIIESVRCNLTFIFIELSEITNSFAKIRLVTQNKSDASFVKTHFL